MSGGNPLTTGRIGRVVYDLRHWKLTLVVAVFIGLPTLILRFLLGRNLIGGGRTSDATFFRGARGECAGWWNDLSGAARAGLRLAAIAAVWLWFHYPVVVYVLGSLELIVVVLSVWRKARDKQHEKRVLRPLWPAVAGIIGIPDTEPPGRWLDIPRNVISDPTADDAVITVGLRAADSDDEKRVSALVQLFDQRFSVPHHGRVDYARRLVHIAVRPPEPAVWPAVANALGVPASELATDWLEVPDDPGTPGARIRIRLPLDVVNEEPITRELKTLVNQRFVGDWSSATVREQRPDVLANGGWPYFAVLTHKKPTPVPPTSVDFFAWGAQEEGENQ